MLSAILWIFPALGSAIFDALKNVSAKRGLEDFDPLIISWTRVVYAAIVVAPFMFIQGIPDVDQTFWVVVVLRTILDAFAVVLYMKAIKLADLSLAVPMLALTPVFLVATEFIVIGDVPSASGFFGILMVVIGAYLLNKKTRQSFFEPFREVIVNRGVFLMLCVAALWGVTSLLHRIGIAHSNPFFYGGVGEIALVFVLTPVALWWNRAGVIASLNPRAFLKVAPTGIFDGLGFLAQVIAQGMTLASYVIAVKRTSIAFSSLLGGYLFGENLKGRIIPIIVMLFGVVCITLL